LGPNRVYTANARPLHACGIGTIVYDSTDCRTTDAMMARCYRKTAFLLFSLPVIIVTCVVLWPVYGSALAQAFPSQPFHELRDFSAKLLWRTEGKTSTSQLFVKGDRYRMEPRAGIRTDLGYAGVAIVRSDQQKVWYVLPRRRMVVSVPLTEEYRLPFSVRLEGETHRQLIGDAFAGGRAAQLYEVTVLNAHRQKETYYEWVDREWQVLLKLVSQSRDWSVEYEHLVLSKQPDYFFEPPRGYRKFETKEVRGESEEKG